MADMYMYRPILQTILYHDSFPLVNLHWFSIDYLHSIFHCCPLYSIDATSKLYAISLLLHASQFFHTYNFTFLPEQFHDVVSIIILPGKIIIYTFPFVERKILQDSYQAGHALLSECWTVQKQHVHKSQKQYVHKSSVANMRVLPIR